MMPEPEEQQKSKKFGGFCTSVALALLFAVIVTWIFNSEPSLRRAVILAALGSGFLVLVAISGWQYKAGQRTFSTVVAGSLVNSVAVNASQNRIAPPRSIPSRKQQLLRSLAGAIGIWTIALGLVAMAMGEPERPIEVERIHSAGAEFADAKIVSVRDVEFHDPSRGKSYYTATATVRLPARSGQNSIAASVKPESSAPLRRGDSVPVLYAPKDPGLGAVAGSKDQLIHKVRGDTLPSQVMWILLGVWAVGVLGSIAIVYGSHGLRGFGRLGRRDRAVRGKCVGAAVFRGKPGESNGQTNQGSKRTLAIETNAHIRAHLIVDLSEGDLPESVKGESVWLCWDALRGSREGRFSLSGTPAALVADSGWVLHGMLPSAESKELASVSIPAEKGGTPSKEEAPLKLWDPRSLWPEYIGRPTLIVFALIMSCSALMTFEVPTSLRWAVGIASPFLVLMLAGLYLSDIRPSDRKKS
jgi:hypothetical protein